MGKSIIVKKNKEPCYRCLVLPICIRKVTCLQLVTDCKPFYDYIVEKSQIFDNKIHERSDDVFTCIYSSPNLDVRIMLIRHKDQTPKDGVQAYFYNRELRR